MMQSIPPSMRSAPTGSPMTCCEATPRRLESPLQLDVIRYRLVSKLDVHATHRLVRLVVDRAHRAPALGLRAREHVDLERHRDALAARVARDAGHVGPPVLALAVAGGGEADDAVAVVGEQREIAEQLRVLGDHLLES